MTQDILFYTGAMAIGALHAFEPGHGKTIIAAYMIGTKGRAKDGIFLGAIVTFTHTFSVIILGLITKMLSTSYSDSDLHNWLGLVSATIILLVGLWMLKQRLSGNGGHHHFNLFGKKTHHHSHHDHEHNHSHDHNHQHPHQHHNHHGPKEAFNKWNLLLLGISGGIIPCPAAITTLLAAVAAGRIADGLTLTIFFSLGLGLVMMTSGALLSQTGRLTQKISDNMELSRKLGVVSALLICSLGLYTLVNSLQNII